ncbi:MAG: ferredoxin family protein [Vulcanibacillus sp.]
MRVVFDQELCKGCGLCLSVCPKNIIILADNLNDKGYRPATVIEQDKCISCLACGIICPDAVITIYRPNK